MIGRLDRTTPNTGRKRRNCLRQGIRNCILERHVAASLTHRGTEFSRLDRLHGVWTPHIRDGTGAGCHGEPMPGPCRARSVMVSHLLGPSVDALPQDARIPHHHRSSTAWSTWCSRPPVPGLPCGPRSRRFAKASGSEAPCYSTANGYAESRVKVARPATPPTSRTQHDAFGIGLMRQSPSTWPITKS